MTSLLAHCTWRGFAAVMFSIVLLTLFGLAGIAVGEYCCVTYGPDGSILHSCPSPPFNCCICTQVNAACATCDPGQSCYTYMYNTGRGIAKCKSPGS
jgi:hypothetical protein